MNNYVLVKRDEIGAYINMQGKYIEPIPPIARPTSRDILALLSNEELQYLIKYLPITATNNGNGVVSPHSISGECASILKERASHE